MKLAITKAAAILVLTLGCACALWAKPPTLTPIDPNGLPTETQVGAPLSFGLTYMQEAGDAPTELKMIVTTPSGEVDVPAAPPGGDPTKGVPVTWSFSPKESGTYKYHFEVKSSTGGFVRYPESPSGDLEFVSFSIVNKYIILVVGIVIALLFLPFIVYVSARALNKQGNPSSAARVALMIGVLASYALFLYLFHTVYSLLMLVLGGVAAVALLIVLFTRK